MLHERVARRSLIVGYRPGRPAVRGGRTRDTAQVATLRTGSCDTGDDRPYLPVPIFDQALVTGCRREDWEEIRILLHYSRRTYGPTVRCAETGDPVKLIEGLSGGWSGSEVPGGSIPVLDHCIQSSSMLISAIADGPAVRRCGAADPLEDATGSSRWRQAGDQRPSSAIPVFREGSRGVAISSRADHGPDCPTVRSGDTGDAEESSAIRAGPRGCRT